MYNINDAYKVVQFYYTINIHPFVAWYLQFNDVCFFLYYLTYQLNADAKRTSRTFDFIAFFIKYFVLNLKVHLGQLQ